MIVMYETGRLLRILYPLFGRYIVKTPHLSLVNILAGRRIVPEFMPYVRDTAEVARVAGQLLVDETWRKIMVEQLGETVRPLEKTNASSNVCRIIREMLNA
jgi:lipid-A-disaccharide synthase